MQRKVSRKTGTAMIKQYSFTSRGQITLIMLFGLSIFEGYSTCIFYQDYKNLINQIGVVVYAMLIFAFTTITLCTMISLCVFGKRYFSGEGCVGLSSKGIHDTFLQLGGGPFILMFPIKFISWDDVIAVRKNIIYLSAGAELDLLPIIRFFIKREFEIPIEYCSLRSEEIEKIFCKSKPDF